MLKKIEKYHLFFAFLYFFILTIIFNFSLIQKITTNVVGGYGDNLYFIWIIGWFKQAIFDLGQLPYRSFLLNHPYGYNLATTEIAPLQILIALPFAQLLNNPILGFNIAMLSTFVLSGLAMYYWVFEMTKSYSAALVSSTAFAFLPYHYAHFLFGHLNLSPIQWFPLFFMGFFRILNQNEFSWKNIVLMTIGLTGIALSSQYYLYMTLFVSAIVGLIVLIRKGKLFHWNIWKQISLVGSFSLPALAVGILPYYLIHGGDRSARALENVMHYSAGLTDYLLPFTKSIIAGQWVSHNFPRQLLNESTLYLGIPVIFMAVYGVVKNKDVNLARMIRIMVPVALIAFVLSMGTNLTWMEKPVLIRTPSFLNGIINAEFFPVYLPGYLLFRYFPFYNVLRVWMRYGIIVMTMTCALAGVGAAYILKGMDFKFRKFAAVGLIGLVMLDFMNTPFGNRELTPRKVDVWLADQPFGGQIQLPLVQSYEQRSIYSTLINQKPLIGQMDTFPSHRYFQLEPVLKNFPNEESIQLFESDQIRYVILDKSFYDVDSTFVKKCQDLGLDFAGSFGGQSVFIYAGNASAVQQNQY